MTSDQETERVYSYKLQLRSSQGARVPNPQGAVDYVTMMMMMMMIFYNYGTNSPWRCTGVVS